MKVVHITTSIIFIVSNVLICAVGDVDLNNLTLEEGIAIYGATKEAVAGVSLSSAGDINNDLCDDIIIGAPHADLGEDMGVGASYVIFGKSAGLKNMDLANLSSSDGFMIFGVQSECLGASVSGAGDVNGDYIDDIIIGAPFANHDAGVAYVIFGKSTGDFVNINVSALSLPDGCTIFGAKSYDSFGTSVRGAGDVNKDGIKDLIIAAPCAVRSAATAYVLYGKVADVWQNINVSTLSPSDGFMIFENDDAQSLGVVIVSGVGDINSDGYNDVIISCPYTSVTGASYIIFGKRTGRSNVNLTSLSSSDGFTLFAAARGDMIGNSVNGAGDVNNDGIDDIIIGAPNASPKGRNKAGTSYVILGRKSGFSNIDLSNLTPSEGFMIFGAANSDHSGVSVSGAGDVNLDGIDDIIIGAEGAGPPDRKYAGTSYILYGKVNITNIDLSTIDPSIGYAILGAYVSEFSGGIVSDGGDFNGDGFAEVLVGAAGVDARVSYILFGASDVLFNPKHPSKLAGL